MYRILVVDDEPTVRTFLADFFKRKAPDFEVDFADCVEAGRALIRRAADKGRPYHAGVLDFMLPRHPGETPFAVDESLCQLLQADAVVLHITVHVGEEDLLPDQGRADAPLQEETLDVLRHLARYHKGRGGPDGDVVSKMSPDWHRKLLQKLRTHLYNRQVREELNDLFGRPEAEAGSDRARVGYRTSRSGAAHSFGVTNLLQDITAYWPYLEDDLKHRIEGIFHVDHQDGRVRVGLL
jgi:CheY-like chemotaxis protein